MAKGPNTWKMLLVSSAVTLAAANAVSCAHILLSSADANVDVPMNSPHPKVKMFLFSWYCRGIRTIQQADQPWT